jgi:hypothetical protein
VLLNRRSRIVIEKPIEVAVADAAGQAMSELLAVELGQDAAAVRPQRRLS